VLLLGHGVSEVESGVDLDRRHRLAEVYAFAILSQCAKNVFVADLSVNLASMESTPALSTLIGVV
jgi:hypothetical protein